MTKRKALEAQVNEISNKQITWTRRLRRHFVMIIENLGTYYRHDLTSSTPTNKNTSHHLHLQLRLNSNTTGRETGSFEHEVDIEVTRSEQTRPKLNETMACGRLDGKKRVLTKRPKPSEATWTKQAIQEALRKRLMINLIIERQRQDRLRNKRIAFDRCWNQRNICTSTFGASFRFANNRKES